MKPSLQPHECANPGEEIRAQIEKASAALHRLLCEETEAGNTQPITVSILRAAFAEVTRTGELLVAHTALDYVALSAELPTYQRLLRQFKSKLPQLHGWLLIERARLANRRSHSAAVEGWLQTSRQTRRNP